MMNRLILSVLLVLSVCGRGEALPLARRIAEDSIDSRLALNESFDPKCLSRFLDYPPAPAAANSTILTEHFVTPFKPNPKFWAEGVDFTCASPWNSGAGRLRAGTAISPRHIIFAKHFPLWKGVRIVFVGTDGSPSAYYIEKTKALEGCDIMLGLLDAELTPDIHSAKIMPLDFTNHLGRAEGLPVVTLSQDEKAYVSELRPLLTNSVYDLVNYVKPKGERRAKYFGNIHGGDSGSPVFVIIGKEPVLLFFMTTSMGGYGVHYFRREIQAAMDELCPGYQLDCFDFSKLES